MKNSPLSIATIAEKARLVQVTVEEKQQLSYAFLELLSERELNNLINQIRVIDEARKHPNKSTELILIENFFAPPIPKKERKGYIMSFFQEKQPEMIAGRAEEMNLQYLNQLDSLIKHRDQQKEKNNSSTSLER